MSEQLENCLLVVSRYHPEMYTFHPITTNEEKVNNNDDGDDDANVGTEMNNNLVKLDKDVEGCGEPILHPLEIRNDGLDDFNHPRYRRAMILKELYQRSKRKSITATSDEPTIGEKISFVTPTQPSTDLSSYEIVQSKPMLEFFTTAWKRWDELGPEGQDPASALPSFFVPENDDDDDDDDNVFAAAFGDDDDENEGKSDKVDVGEDKEEKAKKERHFISPPLIPGNCPLPRDVHQRPSKNVMGQMGYYCTDTCTPIFAELYDELTWDVAVLQRAIQTMKKTQQQQLTYALATHPGHHAAKDSFGGYCYLNHVAYAAKQLQEQPDNGIERVAILDVDYHCGNGTASIFYNDSSIYVISIHCDPDYEYPFHSGFEDEIGGTGNDVASNGYGMTCHVPLPPGTTWKETYKPALKRVLEKFSNYNSNSNSDENKHDKVEKIDALIVSLGLDTHKGDPCAIRRAGFNLARRPDGLGPRQNGRGEEKEGEGNNDDDDFDDDYWEMGTMIGTHCNEMPILVVQEGGYKMDDVPCATADFLLGISHGISTSK